MAKVVLATALAASAATGPMLPGHLATDHSADEIRLHLVRDIRQHRAYVREVRADRRQEARAAAREARTEASSPGATSPSGGTYTTSNGWGDELAAAGFPASVIPTMEYIIQRESGGDPTAVYGGGAAYAGGPACGLVQLFPCPGAYALDPMTNLRLGYEKYAASGLSPWSMG